MRLVTLLLLCVAVVSGLQSVERWGQFELTLNGPSHGNPFQDVQLSATFSLADSAASVPQAGRPPLMPQEVGAAVQGSSSPTVKVTGFYDGEGHYKVRFSPPTEGRWEYRTASNAPSLDCNQGQFQVSKQAPRIRGPVKRSDFGLYYADGTPYFSVGSTSYQWTSKSFEMQAETLETLQNGQGNGPVFNKLRMTVFPKWYEYNHANPVQTGAAFPILPGSLAANSSAWDCIGEHCPSLEGSFDLTRFNVSYWQNYERLLTSMRQSGVEADIIVFHPYDHGHWGFDCMGGQNSSSYDTTNDNFYLKYLAARLASFSNVWWSMANEWNFCACKSSNATQDDSPTPVWDELFETLSNADPYGRQMSIHNGALLYNHSRPWITHVSLQGHEQDTPAIRAKYKKPVLWDEVQYEGDIISSWGALSGPEMADRFWWGASLGVMVGHSETILRPSLDDDAQPLWWAKGGVLKGSSPSRIQWFRGLWDRNSSRPEFGSLVPTQSYLNDISHGDFVVNLLSKPGSFHMLHFLRPGQWTMPLEAISNGLVWEVRELDYWGMTETVVKTLPAGTHNFTLQVPELPANFEVVAVAP